MSAGLGPALVAVPVNWAADALARAAGRWFRRFRRTDGLSRLVRAATGSSVDLTQSELDAIRALLEDQQTWSLAAQGTVEDLVGRIAATLPPREGRTAEDPISAARTIAHGLLEFVVTDLDPEFFQRLMLIRLQRVVKDQATALEKALVRLHGDLITRFMSADEVGAQRFAELARQLKLAVDRLPQGPADRAEITVYLTTLIGWLNADPWPRDRRFQGPALTPAAIERRLRVNVLDKDGEHFFDADELAAQCERLVILGSPGSGKTWLAKRTVRRCAEDALEFLAVGGTLDEVELPLYTTCSRLFAADGHIRVAAVSSAIDQLPDLGGSRISTSLTAFFSDRSGPTVLVIDSLDEAPGSDDRLRQADNLPWRIVLTSRPSSWNQQLTIRTTDDSHQVGELQPLRYPNDVEPFIARWFAGDPDRSKALAGQIAGRPGLQQAATVPLILAFYCIIGADTTTLPEFRHELYAKVLKRILTGRWRGMGEDQPDASACLRSLRAWAWEAAVLNPVSGVGAWVDDFPAKPSQLREVDERSLDHVATPLGPADVDEEITLRRFIHRSIREHLVAEHISTLPVNQVADDLLPHLWYDPDWEYSASAALAMHPLRDQLLRDLICRAARSDQLPVDVSVIDGAWEFRRLLARLAAESNEADWSFEVAVMIGRARVKLAESGSIDDLGGAANWEASNRSIRGILISLLAARRVNPAQAEQLTNLLAQLSPTPEDMSRARDQLLRLLADETDAELIQWRIGPLVRLSSTAEDKCKVRDALLRLLAASADGAIAAELAAGLVRFDPASEDQRQARKALLKLLTEHKSHAAEEIVARLIRLASTAEDQHQVRRDLLEILAGESNSGVAEALVSGVVSLAMTAHDKREVSSVLLNMLTGEIEGWAAEGLASGVVQLAQTAGDKAEAREILLGLLARQPEEYVATQLVASVIALDPTAWDKDRARRVMLELLAGQMSGWAAWGLAVNLAQLDPGPDDQRRAREVLLRLLAKEKNGWVAVRLAHVLVQHDLTVEDQWRVCRVLLRLLAGETNDGTANEIAAALVQFAPAAEDKDQACQAVLALLADRRNSHQAGDLAAALSHLAQTAEDKCQIRRELLSLLDSQTNGLVAVRCVQVLGRFDPTADDQSQASRALLKLLVFQTNETVAGTLLNNIVQLSQTGEVQYVRETLLGLLSSRMEPWAAELTVNSLAQLAYSADDNLQVRDVLLRLLSMPANDHVAPVFAAGLAQFGPTSEDKRQARQSLLRILSKKMDSKEAQGLVESLAQLDPTTQDIKAWRGWAGRPTAELLAEIRQNSALADWLAVIPSLASLSL